MTPVGYVRELIPTYQDTTVHDTPSVISSAVLASIIRPLIGPGDLDEHAWAVYLNGNNRILAVYKISEGGTTNTVMPPSKVLRGAILTNAAAFAVAHNHPSGEAHPSAADRRVTEDLVKAGHLLGIVCLDSLILGAKGHYSFADAGLIAEYRTAAERS